MTDCSGSSSQRALIVYTTSAMSKRTAAAAAAAHAASKRNSVIELNAGSEERARQALQVCRDQLGLQRLASRAPIMTNVCRIGAGLTSRPSANTAANYMGQRRARRSTRRPVRSSAGRKLPLGRRAGCCSGRHSLSWLVLLSETRTPATNAQHPTVQAIPLEQMSEASVLDWLCLNVDPAHLPKR